MNKNDIEIFGYIGGFLTTISLFPQIYTSITGHKKISVVFLYIFLLGIIFWTIYGSLIYSEEKKYNNNQGLSIIIFNSIAIISVLIIIVYTHKNK